MDMRFVYLVIILCLLSLEVVDGKKKKKNKNKNTEDEDYDDDQSVERTPRNRDYNGKEKFGMSSPLLPIHYLLLLNYRLKCFYSNELGPIIGYGPFKVDRGGVADRGYDVGFILGQGYGAKLSKGITSGIKKSLKPGFFSKRQDDDEDEEE